ncbi:uncharacterized protein LOC131236676 isoform X2 [Magnolia sinica]|uniref:uncharacterized protein LOC131236676 isoform X2 n=1 Tax=Magnolia sinica TaxID=86752 RepID=UPI00265B67ED|nr:uncharacterized protein LOC131236676 isoform X2 [Magnolia sinica]
MAEEMKTTDFEDPSDSVEREAEMAEDAEEGGEEGEEEGDGGEHEGEEDPEDEEYTALFEGNKDLLDYAEDDTFGLKLYQQFERRDYEALAERKRKALSDPCCNDSAKKLKQDDFCGTSIDEIREMMDFGWRRKSRKTKKRGRRKGSKNKLSPEVTRKLGDATLHYASGRYDEAVCVLKEVVKLAPTLADPYYTLGLVHNANGDRKRAFNFYMIAAHVMPKDPSLWKLLVTWSIDIGNSGLVMYCLSKAITADPKDMGLRFDRASLFVELGHYQKAAESYDQILGLCPANVEARMMAAKMYQKCGQVERAINTLEDYIKYHPTEIDLSIVNLLASIYMENKQHVKALLQIENARSVYCSSNKFPLCLTVKEGICQAYLGNMEKAEILLVDLQMEKADHGELITEVADSFMNLGQYESALKYYFMLDGTNGHENVYLDKKIAQCYISLKERAKAIAALYKVLLAMEDDIDSRLTLASLLLDEEKKDEAITVLSPPKNQESTIDTNSVGPKPWWLSGKVRFQLAKIYHAKGMLEDFVDAIFSSIRETLFIETMNQKVRVKKKLTKSVLNERIKVAGDYEDDSIFRGFRPIGTIPEMAKASRAKKSLQKLEAVKEEKKAAALAAGLDWQSDESDDESPPKALREPPLPKLLKDEEHYQLTLDLCKALASLQRSREALEIINHTLRLAHKTLSVEEEEELRSLGAQIACNTTDPMHGYDHVRHRVRHHPYSSAAWNGYYKVVSRFGSRLPKHDKFLPGMRDAHPDCVHPVIIRGHQSTMKCKHQDAAREYLQAYKVQPDNPLVNLCAGTALINLALGLRVRNRHQCIAQGFAFLYNYMRLCKSSQVAGFNQGAKRSKDLVVYLAVVFYSSCILKKKMYSGSTKESLDY